MVHPQVHLGRRIDDEPGEQRCPPGDLDAESARVVGADELIDGGGEVLSVHHVGEQVDVVGLAGAVAVGLEGVAAGQHEAVGGQGFQADGGELGLQRVHDGQSAWSGVREDAAEPGSAASWVTGVSG